MMAIVAKSNEIIRRKIRFISINMMNMQWTSATNRIAWAFWILTSAIISLADCILKFIIKLGGIFPQPTTPVRMIFSRTILIYSLFPSFFSCLRLGYNRRLSFLGDIIKARWISKQLFFTSCTILVHNSTTPTGTNLSFIGARFTKNIVARSFIFLATIYRTIADRTSREFLSVVSAVINSFLTIGAIQREGLTTPTSARSNNRPTFYTKSIFSSALLPVSIRYRFFAYSTFRSWAVSSFVHNVSHRILSLAKFQNLTSAYYGMQAA